MITFLFFFLFSPLCLFFDFESLLVPVDYATKKCDECRFNCKCEKSYTINTHEHRPIIFSYVIVNQNHEIVREGSGYDYTGNAHKKFLEEILSLEDDLQFLANRNIPFQEMTGEEYNDQLESQQHLCCYCECDLRATDEVKVIDHCHFDGSVIGMLVYLFIYFYSFFPIL